MAGEQITWLSMREAAAHVGMSYGRFAEKVRKGEIPASRVPGFTRTKRINKERLDQLMDENAAKGSSN